MEEIINYMTKVIASLTNIAIPLKLIHVSELTLEECVRITKNIDVIIDETMPIIIKAELIDNSELNVLNDKAAEVLNEIVEFGIELNDKILELNGNK